MHRSALVGIAVLALVLLADGYFVGRANAQADNLVRFLRVEYVPHPRDIVNLVEGAPYTVPTGKILVLRDFAISDVPATNVGDTQTGFTVALDGQVVWKSGGGIYYSFFYTGNSPASCQTGFTRGQDVPLGPLQVGVVARVAQVVTIDSIVGTAYAAGFLADE